VFVLVLLTRAIACGGTNAAEMPSKFRGVWGGTNCDIPKDQSDVGEFPFLIVTAKGFEEHETICNLISSSKIRGTDRQSLTFSCLSEAEHYKSKEDWSIAQKKTKMDSFLLSQSFLIRGGPRGARLPKCAFSAAPIR